MPELPEVETVRRTLEPLVVGRTFTHVTISWPGCDAQGDGRSLAESLPGARCVKVGRRGKYLLVHLDGERTLVVHLRMTGRLIVVDGSEPITRHERIRLHMDDGTALSFADQRKFGRLTLARDAAALANVLRRLGPEPAVSQANVGHLIGSLTSDALLRSFASRRAPVKAILLDQRVVAGLGNIYVDEVLFVAGLHPATHGRDCAKDAVERIVRATATVLDEAIADGGTTLADYRDATGATGAHQTRLRVFRRHGQPCRDCGSQIERCVIAQRGTHFCPACQPRPR